MAGFRTQLNQQNINKLIEAQHKAALKTANSIRVDVSAAQTVPFDTGELERSFFAQQEQDGNVSIYYSAPYAAVQYFDASLDHSKGGHAGTATDHWLEPYLANGAKKTFASEKFSGHLRKEIAKIQGGP